MEMNFHHTECLDWVAIETTVMVARRIILPAVWESLLHSFSPLVLFPPVHKDTQKETTCDIALRFSPHITLFFSFFLHLVTIQWLWFSNTQRETLVQLLLNVKRNQTRYKQKLQTHYCLAVSTCTSLPNNTRHKFRTSLALKQSNTADRNLCRRVTITHVTMRTWKFTKSALRNSCYHISKHSVHSVHI